MSSNKSSIIKRSSSCWSRQLLADDFHELHLPGAINIPADQIRSQASELLPKKAEIIVYYFFSSTKLPGVRSTKCSNIGMTLVFQALAQYRLGQLYFQDGHALKAVEQLKQALFYAPNDRATLYNSIT